MAVSQLQRVVRRLHGIALGPIADGATDSDLLQRFVRETDGPAFAALVRRHGALVWGVCQRVLMNRADAEDAFQATFVVLVRKASSLRRPEALGNWLYGVAFRTALEARRARARRRRKEAMAMATMATRETPSGDLRAVLDQELAVLADKYREVVVLCDLEGKTRKEAAQVLHCAEGNGG